MKMLNRPGKPFRLILLLVTWIVAGTLSGCSAEAPRKHDWIRRDGTGESLEKAREACSERATDVTAKLAHDRAATHVIINEFLKCMREKGWELEEEDDD